MKLISHDLQDGGKLPLIVTSSTAWATMATIFRRI